MVKSTKTPLEDRHAMVGSINGVMSSKAMAVTYIKWEKDAMRVITSNFFLHCSIKPRSFPWKRKDSSFKVYLSSSCAQFNLTNMVLKNRRKKKRERAKEQLQQKGYKNKKKQKEKKAKREKDDDGKKRRRRRIRKNRKEETSSVATLYAMALWRELGMMIKRPII